MTITQQILFCPNCLSTNCHRARDWFNQEFDVCDDCSWTNRPSFDEWEVSVQGLPRCTCGGLMEKRANVHRWGTLLPDSDIYICDDCGNREEVAV